MRTQRLVLEKFEEADFENYRRLVLQGQVMRLVTGRALSNQEAEMRFKNILAINRAYKKFGYFAVRRVSENAFIGLGKIVLTEEEDAEIGYLLLPENWGKGYGSEITQCLVQHAGSVSQLKTLSAIIDPENVASRRILEKHNFRLVKAYTQDNLPAELYRRTIL